MTKFKDLLLPDHVLQNLEKAGYETPTPIQGQSIPILMEGHDLLGIAQTGTGKTAAFLLPIINYLLKNPQTLRPCEPRVLILAPTRELASQINENFHVYAHAIKLKSTVIFGGVGEAKQIAALRGGLDILVATPGRLLDHMNQGHCRLNKIETFVLDEADRMLDMGFIHDIRKVVAKLPEKRQTIMFSATMPGEISKLAHSILRQPKRVEVTPQSTTVERIKQKLIHVRKAEKYQLLRKILTEDKVSLTLVFTRTKHGANKVVDYLKFFKIESAAIHGNKSQSAREQALENFKSGKIKVLVATDIAARGIDVDDVSHVINFDLPMEPESYVHRIGRTARAGKDGEAYSFCDETEGDILRKIEKIIGMKLESERFVGVPEQSVKMTRPERPFRDPRAKPKHRQDGPRKDGPRRDGPRHEGQRNDRPRHEGPRNEGPRTEGARPEQKKPNVGFKFRKRRG